MMSVQPIEIQSQEGWGRIRQRPLLGTFVAIGIGDAAGVMAADAAINAAFETMEAVQRLMSFHDPQSELSRLNFSGGKAVRLRPLTRRALYLAQQMTLASGGLFNCTVGGAVVGQGALPDCGPCFAPVGQADDLIFEGETVRLKRAVLITLDGIAKGFAIDTAVKTLKSAEVESAYVNAGGDLRIYGALSTPVCRREIDGRLTPLGALKEAAMATSQYGGDPDRFRGALVTAAGHSPMRGVWTVLAKQAWRADALTKVAALCESPQRAALIEKLRGRWVE